MLEKEAANCQYADSPWILIARGGGGAGAGEGAGRVRGGVAANYQYACPERELEFKRSGAGAGEGGAQLSIHRFPVHIDCEGRRRRRCWRRSGPSTWRRSGGPTRSGPRPTPPAGDARDRMIIFIIIIIIIDYYYHIVFARRPLVMRGPGLYGCY